jgi:hypothetical protein
MIKLVVFTKIIKIAFIGRTDHNLSLCTITVFSTNCNTKALQTHSDAKQGVISNVRNCLFSFYFFINQYIYI